MKRPWPALDTPGVSLETLASRPMSNSPPTPAAIEAIGQIGMEHAPLEACGLLFLGVGPRGKDVVTVIQNMDEHPESNSLMRGDNILDAVMLVTGDKPNDYDLTDRLIFWHTHPGGQRGPSTIDRAMRDLYPDRRLLVVAIPSVHACEY